MYILMINKAIKRSFFVLFLGLLSRRNRWHFLRVAIESQKHSWKFGRTRKSSAFLVLPNFYSYFYNSIVRIIIQDDDSIATRVTGKSFIDKCGNPWFFFWTPTRMHSHGQALHTGTDYKYQLSSSDAMTCCSSVYSSKNKTLVWGTVYSSWRAQFFASSLGVRVGQQFLARHLASSRQCLRVRVANFRDDGISHRWKTRWNFLVAIILAEEGIVEVLCEMLVVLYPIWLV